MATPVLTASKKLKVFISYSRKDMAFADRLETALKAAGIETLIDRTEIYAFEDWWRRIQSLIAQADTVIFALSPDAINSEVCQKEVSFSASLNKRFAPIVLKRVDAKLVPPELSQLNFIFFDNDDAFDESLSRLQEALSTNIDWIRRHTDLGGLSRHWSAAKRPKGMLLRSPMLEQAEQWIASRPDNAPEPTAETREFIFRSRRSKTRSRNTLISSLSLGLLLALGLAGLAYWQRGIAIEQTDVANQQRDIAGEQRDIARKQTEIAEEQRSDANKQRDIAKEQRDQALITQSKYLADASRQALEQSNDPGTAMLLAIEALPDQSSKDEITRTRPHWPAAEVALEAASRKLSELNHLDGHNEQVSSLAWSPDGSYVVTGSWDGTARVWDSKTLSLRAILRGHTGKLSGVAVSPDGAYIVTASVYETRVWDGKTFARGAVTDMHSEEFMSVAVTSDSKRILLSGGNTKLLDPATLAETASVKGSAYGEVAASPTGSHIFTTDKNAVLVWDAKTLTELHSLEGHTESIRSIAISGDGTRIVTGSGDKTARVWDGQTFKELAILKGHTDDVWSVAISPDGRVIVTGGDDAKVRIWDSRSFVELDTLEGHTARVTSIAFSPDGTQIATASGTKVRFWRTKNFSRLAILMRDADRARGGPKVPDSIAADAVRSVAITPDGKRIVAGWDDKHLRIWDAQTFAEIASANVDDQAFSLAISPDGSRVIAGMNGGTVQVFDSTTLTRLAAWKGHGTMVQGVAVSPDGTRLVSGSGLIVDVGRKLQDNSVRVWDAHTFKELAKLTGHAGLVSGVAFAPDGTRFISGSWDGTAKVWNASTFAELASIEHPHRVSSVAMSPNGIFIVTGTEEGKVRVWNGATFAAVATLEGHSGSVLSVAVTPDSKRIITGSSDKTVRVWDAKTFKELAVLKGHTHSVEKAAVSPDGARIASASYDSTVRVWAVQPHGQELIEQAKSLAPRCLSRKERERYNLPEDAPAWCTDMRKWPHDAATAMTSGEGLLDAATEEWSEGRASKARESLKEAELWFFLAFKRNPAYRPHLDHFRVSIHNTIAWHGFLDVFLNGKPAESLNGILPDAHKAVELSPDNKNILDTRGQILIALGRVDEGMTDLDKAIGLGTKSGGTFYARGRGHELRKNRDAAIADYRKALELIDEEGGRQDSYIEQVIGVSCARLTEFGVSQETCQKK